MLKIYFALLKYMISPVTSTNVAKNGAEMVAGSSLMSFRPRGSNAPTRLPQATIPTIPILMAKIFKRADRSLDE